MFGDRHGNLVHLGERDCSIQRRHQKVIEEAPSPVVDAPSCARGWARPRSRRRARSTTSAPAPASSCSAPTASFYFLEMNTRLQVEHPVTEMIYGVDLVAWQLDVAEGEPLPMTQAELDARRRGHAVECRIYAEDPVKFLPSPGRITHLRVPDGPYVRNDSGCYEGAEIPVHYDPMISKLVVWGEDRAARGRAHAPRARRVRGPRHRDQPRVPPPLLSATTRSSPATTTPASSAATPRSSRRAPTSRADAAIIAAALDAARSATRAERQRPAPTPTAASAEIPAGVASSGAT